MSLTVEPSDRGSAEAGSDRSKGDLIREILQEFVETAEADQRLPSERVLADRFGFARGTIRQEIDRLESEGLVYRRPQSGTYVARRDALSMDLALSFTERMRRRGVEPGTSLLAARLEPATEWVTEALQIPGDAEVFRLSRLRTADGLPVIIEHTYLPAGRFPGIDTVDWAKRSLLETLAERWGEVAGATSVQISAILPSREQSGLLRISSKLPCFQLRDTTFDTAREPIATTVSIFSADRMELVTNFDLPSD